MKAPEKSTTLRAVLLLMVMFTMLPAVLLASEGEVLWIRDYDDPVEQTYVGADIIETADGGYIWIGYSAIPITSTRTIDSLHVIKTNAHGYPEWQQKYDLDGEMLQKFTISLRQIADGSYVITGATRSEAFLIGGKAFLLHLEPNGAVRSKHYYGPSDNYNYSCYDAAQTSDGGFLLVGDHTNMVDTPPEGEYPPIKPFIARTDSNGDTLWTRIYFREQANYYYTLHSIIPTSDGNFIATGVMFYNVVDNGSLNHTKNFLMKMDVNGDTLWTKLDGGRWDSAYDIKQTDDDGYICAGEYFNEVMYPGIRVAKYSATGDSLWSFYYSDVNGDTAFTTYSMQLTADGGVIVGGYGEYHVPNPNDPMSDIQVRMVFLLRSDQAGNILWTKSYPTELGFYSSARRIIQASNDTYLIVGFRYASMDAMNTAFISCIGSHTSAAPELEQALPADYLLVRNYPNPFNNSTVISYQLPQTAPIRIDVYDLVGRKVQSLLNATQSTGQHQVVWNAANQASGIYYYKVQAGDQSKTGKMILIK